MSTGTSSATARRRLPPEERREQIVEEAVAYFAEIGLEGNTRGLSKRMGVTQSLIFNYFSTKADLIEAVYRKVYLDRISPTWPTLMVDRSLPIRERLLRFYDEYTRAIFTYEWLRIFMFSGLAGAELNRRYLFHLRTLVLYPMLQELRAAASGPDLPQEEDMWNLHGGIIYIGIRRFVYQMPTPDDDTTAITASIDRFLKSFDIG